MRLLVAGVGSRYRGDDAAGLAVAARLREALGAEQGVEVLELEGEPLNLLERLEGVEALLVVDAVESGAPPGAVHRFEAGAEPLPAELRTDSTHALSVAEALELARALGRLPPRVVVFGIEGASFEASDRLSPAVEAALDECADLALAQARELLG